MSDTSAFSDTDVEIIEQFENCVSDLREQKRK